MDHFNSKFAIVTVIVAPMVYISLNEVGILDKVIKQRHDLHTPLNHIRSVICHINDETLSAGQS